MFTKPITSLKMAGPDIAETLFQNIKGCRYQDDVSFTATLRALLSSRLRADEHLILEISASTYSRASVSGATQKDCIWAFLKDGKFLGDPAGTLHIHNFCGDEDGNTACFEILDKQNLSNLEKFRGFVPLDDIAQFLNQKKIRSRFYINDEKHSALIFVENLDLKRWHLLQSLIPRYFPSWFKDNPINETETALLKSLTNRYAPSYEEVIDKIAGQFDFRTQFLKTSLTGFENNFERRKLNDIRIRIKNCQNHIESLQQNINSYFAQMEEYTVTELGLCEKLKQGGESEVLDYFLCNKSLELVSAYGGEITFIVNTVISSFDPDLFDSIIQRDHSFFYQHYETGEGYGNPDFTDERIKKLMMAIFHDELLKLRVCAAYRLNFENSGYEGIRHYAYPADVLADHTPNQHIDYYACLGNNRQVVGEAMRRKDYIAAISACCSSATNINLTESNTGTFFMQKILAKNAGKIIQMPDGSTMTPIDAVKWLEANEAKEEETTHE